jgi:hypothetical protein
MMGRCFAVVSLALGVSTPAFAQGFSPLPNQLSVGIGVVADRPAGQQAPTFSFSFAFVEAGDYWPYRLGLVFEAESSEISDAEPCRARDDAQLAEPPNCWDDAILAGVRFNFVRRQGRQVLPFVHLLLGAYWKGSGVSDLDFESGRFALQVGGGVDLRRTGSVHAVRLSVDYRHVFETDAGRNQLRFLTAYVLGPPETKTPHPAPGR